MTRHEPIDPKTRVARHRAAMRAKGYRLKQIWVRDTRDPAFLAEIRAACEAIAASPQEKEDILWAERFADEAMADWPPYDDEPRTPGEV